jgi:hypothetical protein
MRVIGVNNSFVRRALIPKVVQIKKCPPFGTELIRLSPRETRSLCVDTIYNVRKRERRMNVDRNVFSEKVQTFFRFHFRNFVGPVATCEFQNSRKSITVYNNTLAMLQVL